MGTPVAAVPFLDALVDAGHDVALVVTNPDKRRGRGGDLIPSPVKAAALARGLTVTSNVDDILGAGVDRGVVVAFGRLIKPHVLERVPMVNVHFSLLPRWRGAAPVERAILAGDAETGVCLMELEEGLDTGPVYACERVAIGPEQTVDELRNELVAVGVPLLVNGLAGGLGEARPQEGESTYAAKVEPDELRIDWTAPADEVLRVVRLGRAWTTFRGKRLRILRAGVVAVGPDPGVLDGVVVGAGDAAGVELIEVQPEGRAAQAADAWRNGARPDSGERLGQ
ncbi:MAG TPA: methionyl-tRNA formyltransferase [Acidimicrobiales bacterium]|nr:methionyl-tRNA formyltransferase [Acidimicrobiales bacterium]